MKQKAEVIGTGRKNMDEQISHRTVNRGEISRKAVNNREMDREKARRIRARKKRQARIRRRKQIFCVICAAGFVLIVRTLFHGSVGNTVENEIFGVDGKTILARIVGNASDADRTIPQIYKGDDMEKQLKELASDSDGFRQIYEKWTEYPTELLSAVCSNPEMLDYALGFPDAEKVAAGGLTDQEKEENFPLLLQWDKRWGYAAYGESYIGLSGCAPTCLSMVTIALTRQSDVTPDAVAKYAEESGYYVNGTGTAWSLMTEGATHFGVSGREISLSENTVLGQLQSGHPIICSMRPGDFTTQGHFIVLVGAEDGKIIVNDPNSKERSCLLWDYDTLAGQIKNLWAFERS